MDLSLVMPAYNEGNSIVTAIDHVDHVMSKIGINYELIVVNDGSIDDTLEKIMNFANNNHHVKVLSYERNMGKGYAIKTGFLHATGDIVIFLDSDLDINPEQVVHYINALKDGDVVIASKWHPKSVVKMPLIRRFLSHGFNLLVQLLTGVRLKDTQTGLKAVKREALKKVFRKLSVKRYAFDAELLAVATLYELKVIELPVNLEMHSYFSLKEVWRMFVNLLGIAYRLRIKKWYQNG
jgi:glycosyltransferase involved in cell wall biosynthesis